MEKNISAESTFSRLLQVGVVVKDLDQTIERLAALGVGPFTPKNPPPDVKEDFRGKPFIPREAVDIKAAWLGNVELELIQPLKGDSPHKEYLDQKGEGIQHLAFAVSDLSKEVNKLTERGCEVLLRSPRKDGGGIAYVDLKVGGIIVELVQKK
jgi:methylmalonyl-CoA/ethylmalonyl-CoA epimerase